MRRFSWMTAGAILTIMATACTRAGEPASMDPDSTAMAATEAGLACEPTASGADLADRASPYDSASIAVADGYAKVCYSRPSLRGRTMIGGENVPYDQLWRFGANEPTIIHVDRDASIAGIEVEPGSYSLYTIPTGTGDWTLIVNASTSQWGHERYYTDEVEAQDVGRTEVRTERLDGEIEDFTIRPMEDGAGFVAEWQNSRILIPVTPTS